MSNRAHPAQRGRRAWLAAALSVALPLVGCDNLLTVEDPDVARPESIRAREAVPTAIASAIGDFAVAYSGFPGSEGIILASGMMADEYHLSGSFPTRLEVDSRRIDVNNATMEGLFRRMHRARVSAERAVSLTEEFTPGTEGQALSLALAGYTYIFFAENYCSGVPFSSVTQAGQFEFGPPQTTEQMLNTAVARFDQALAAAPASAAAVRNLARVGRARALLDLGQFQEAATTVASVPTSFVFAIEHSENSTRQQNGVHNLVNIAKRWSVSDTEGDNGLPYRSADDPRVRWARTGVGFDGSTPHFSQLKYPNRSSSVPLASGVEARLIEAEAQLRSGNSLGFVATLNSLRQGASLAPVVGPLTQNERVDLLFRERAFWLWQTAHRLGDLRRLVRQYGRAEDDVFPTGAYFKGGTYGDDVNFPVPRDEQNNPNFEQCLNRDA